LGWDKTYFGCLTDHYRNLNINAIETNLKYYDAPQGVEWRWGQEEGLSQLAKSVGVTEKKLQKLSTTDLLNTYFWGKQWQHLFVLGESGFGKTTFLQQTFVEWAKRNPPYDMVFIYSGEHTLAQIKAIENAENTILFIDALDEDRAFRRDFEKQKKALQKVFEQKKFHQIIFSCRTEFFEQREKEFDHLLSDNLNKAVAYRLLLKGFTDLQVQNFSYKRFDHQKHHKVMKLVKYDLNQPEVKPIFKRPFLMYHIDKFLKADLGSNPTELALYQTLIKVWAEEDKEKLAVTYKEDTVFLESEIFKNYVTTIEEFSKKVAKAIYETDNQIAQALSIDKIYEQAEAAGLTEVEARTNSFLKRSQDNIYAFAHQSIYEYFLAVLRMDKALPTIKNFPKLAQTFYAQLIYPTTVKARKRNYEGKDLGNYGYFLENIDLEGVMEVMFSDEKILEEHQKYLALILENCNLQSIAFAKKLKNAKVLLLSNNQISDISPLEKLVNLTRLGLENNQISDISPLEKLVNLTKLGLENNQISYISPLKKLVNLTTLGLYNNQISDISPLEKLVNLTELGLSNNQISYISPLQNLKKLQILFLQKNKIEDISPLFELENLQSLYLYGNPLSDTKQIDDLRKKLPNCHIIFTKAEAQLFYDHYLSKAGEETRKLFKESHDL
jgi:GTPase SAR1 family protein